MSPRIIAARHTPLGELGSRASFAVNAAHARWSVCSRVGDLKGSNPVSCIASLPHGKARFFFSLQQVRQELPHGGLLALGRPVLLFAKLMVEKFCCVILPNFFDQLADRQQPPAATNTTTNQTGITMDVDSSLRELGIRTVSELASAEPSVLANAGIDRREATPLIETAKKRLARA